MLRWVSRVRQSVRASASALKTTLHPLRYEIRSQVGRNSPRLTHNSPLAGCRRQLQLARSTSSGLHYGTTSNLIVYTQEKGS